MQNARKSSGVGERLFALFILTTLFAKIPGLSLVPLSVFIGIVILPFIISRRNIQLSRGVKVQIFLILAAILNGFMLRINAISNGNPLADSTTVATLILWTSAFAIIPILGYWAIAKVDFRTGLIFCFGGALTSNLFLEGHWSWKSGVGTCAVLLILSLIGARSVGATRVALILAAATFAASDSRAMAGICLIAIILTLIPNRISTVMIKKPKTSGLIVSLGALAIGLAASSAMASGVLGKEIQSRTMDQTTNGGPLILGARPELLAASALAEVQPRGFGIGVIPSDAIQGSAIAAVAAAKADYTAPYWSLSVFGQRTDLHSIFVNMWFHFGVVGIILGLVIAYYLVISLAPIISRGKDLGGAPLVAVLIALWHLGFSPLGSADRVLMGLLCCAWAINAVRLNPKIIETSVTGIRI